MNRIALAALAALSLAACATPQPPPAAPAVDASLSPQARWEAGQAAYLAWNARQPGWKTTASGLQYKVLKRAPAAAPKPAPGATVTIHYTGTFIDGRKFDSSRDRGEPATFPLTQLIKGWQEGVPMMRVGERWLFAIPGDLAYGSRNRDPIPPNSALVFDIELIAIPGEDAGG
ncbi:FKBP-type peptidyl-prolyl cis-trans isomerase [Phenylobacterium sp.]|uniref:FKBP-type peptidyl-prolyl cis-trans isomerase n=1 Tax=Phenylobacterium sp. TaxID=1871053 RepID=UPI002F95EE26